MDGTSHRSEGRTLTLRSVGSECADVNAVNRDKETALHRAARRGHVDVVKVLVQSGADVNAVNRGKETALHVATDNGHGGSEWCRRGYCE